MLSLHQRFELVAEHAWNMLPPLKREAVIDNVVLSDLGAIHGSFSLDDHVLRMNWRLFDGAIHEIPMIDQDGNDPPLCYPCVGRGLATFIHEYFHAIGAATGFDEAPAWLALSGFVQASDDPIGTGRYWERRPGWEQGPSDWRFRLGTWWPREYSSKSPYEDAADCCTHIALGWTDYFGVAGAAKLAYLRRTVWEETGARSMQATAQRWRERLVGAR